MPLLRPVLMGAAGAAAYSVLENRLYRFQRHRLAVRATAPELDILHISDFHVRASNKALLAFVQDVVGRIPAPDLIVATGDMLENDTGIEPLLDALEGMRARYGCYYVLGSHDYYQSRFRLPIKYFITKDPELHKLQRADTDRFEKGLQGMGWTALTNRTETVATPHGTIRVAGVDDPYLSRAQTEHIERSPDDVFAIGLTHSPENIARWSLNGFDLVVAGHTHGGQVRAPIAGAIVTNSSLPCGLAMGPNKVGDMWLHVSPGLGTAISTPIRFLCRPEITLLELRHPA